MLDLIDHAVESLLRGLVPLSDDVDVSFDAPDRDWAGGVIHPTINAFLWNVSINTDQTHAGLERVVDGDGRVARRPPLPRVDCLYFVSAWTTDVRDEHGLLGAVLVALQPHGDIEPEHLPEPLREVKPLPGIRVASVQSEQRADFWTALGGRLKPGLDVAVTATVDVTALTKAGPPVLRYGFAVEDRYGTARTERHRMAGETAPSDEEESR
jgi:Pvc16 N-terminal domain